MNDLLSWLHRHPIKACGFTAMFMFMACEVAHGRELLVVPYVTGIIWWACVFRSDMRMSREAE